MSENVSIEEVLNSHDFELIHSKNGLVIKKGKKQSGKFLEGFILSIVVLGFIVLLGGFSANRKFIIGVIVVLVSLYGFYKRRSSSMFKEISLSKYAITTKRKKEKQELKINNIRKVFAEVVDNEDDVMYGQVGVQLVNNEKVVFLTLHEENVSFLKKDLESIQKFILKEIGKEWTKPKLLILSDLFGNRNANWKEYYIELLKDKFEIQYYDSSELANIPTTIKTEKELHQRFVNGGINRAVKNLLSKAKGIDCILGISVGGTIAWQAVLAGLKAEKIIAISATRLRYEKSKPICKLQLYFGANDSYRPQQEWFDQMNLEYTLYENEAHDLYKKPEIIKQILVQV